MSDTRYTYKVNFEKNGKLETISKYGCEFSRGSSNRLGVELTSLKQPKVPIESIRDIYKVLTDRENLDILLEQYLEHRRNNPLDYWDNPNFDYAKRKEQHDTQTLNCRLVYANQGRHKNTRPY